MATSRTPGILNPNSFPTKNAFKKALILLGAKQPGWTTKADRLKRFEDDAPESTAAKE